MEVYLNIQDIRTKLDSLRIKGSSIGLVPTMGSLHTGHASLINKSRSQNNLTVASIYVNPTQFNNASDLQHYPRSLESDLEVLNTAGCDMVFVPSDDEMYPNHPTIKFDFGHLGEILEGKFRPGHFNGVGQVVTKLFHIIQPDRAYFGEKDLQQLMIIRQLVSELNFGIEIVGVKTLREKSGLAMSSRNERLRPEQREKAAIIYASLLNGRRAVLDGQTLSKGRLLIEEFLAEQGIIYEYVEFINMKNFTLLENFEASMENGIAICIAAHLEPVRLIDNIILRREEMNNDD